MLLRGLRMNRREVSISMVSPSLMNNGTRTVAPILLGCRFQGVGSLCRLSSPVRSSAMNSSDPSQVRQRYRTVSVRGVGYNIHNHSFQQEVHTVSLLQCVRSRE